MFRRHALPLEGHSGSRCRRRTRLRFNCGCGGGLNPCAREHEGCGAELGSHARSRFRLRGTRWACLRVATSAATGELMRVDFWFQPSLILDSLNDLQHLGLRLRPRGQPRRLDDVALRRSQSSLEAEGRDPRFAGQPLQGSAALRRKTGATLPDLGRDLDGSDWELPTSRVSPQPVCWLAGLRLSAAIKLRFDDLTQNGLDHPLLEVRKSRLVPLHDTARIITLRGACDSWLPRIRGWLRNAR